MRKSFGLAIAILTLALMANLTAYCADPEIHHLGPTGLLGALSKNSIKITDVMKGGPSEGRIQKGDEVTGAGTAAFRMDPRRELAAAIDEAETEKSGGKLTLILKGGKKVDLQLTVLGSYSQTAPWDCSKSKAIVDRAAEAVLRDKDFEGATYTGLLGLLATGEKKYIDQAAKVIQNADWVKPSQADIDAMFAGEKDLGYVGWYWGYRLIVLGEYYLLTKDASVLPAIKTYALGLARGQDAGGLYGHRMATPARNGRLPGYAQMNQPSISSFMGMLMAERCGIDDPVLKKGIARTGAYYETFIGRGAFNYGVHGPNTKTFNNNGTSGSAALCMALRGNSDGAKFFSQLSAASYDGLEKGHASTFFNPLWTPLGANLSGTEVAQMFFNKSRWLHTMYRSWDGSFSRYGGKQKEGSQTGIALLAYCLPRKVLFITGKDANPVIWAKGDEAVRVIGLSEIDYDSKSAEELLTLFGHAIPQVRIPAVWALRKKEGDFAPRLKEMMKNGARTEKISALDYFGWQSPTNLQLAVKEDIGAVLRNGSEDPEVRAAAAASLSWLGEAAYGYYSDMVALVAEDRPGDAFGDIDWSLGTSINRLCSDPFKAGIIKDKAVFYRAAIKLAKNNRQQARAEGMRMLEGMPLEDFHIVADTVVHVIEDKDPTYHSYHSPGGPIGSGVAILARLNIREGMDYALGIMDIESGKGSFKMRAVMDSLAYYGANAKPVLERLKADKDWQTVPDNGKLKSNWDNMVKAIEGDKNPKKLITLEEARQAGGK